MLPSRKVISRRMLSPTEMELSLDCGHTLKFGILNAEGMQPLTQEEQEAAGFGFVR